MQQKISLIFQFYKIVYEFCNNDMYSPQNCSPFWGQRPFVPPGPLTQGQSVGWWQQLQVNVKDVMCIFLLQDKKKQLGFFLLTDFHYV